MSLTTPAIPIAQPVQSTPTQNVEVQSLVPRSQTPNFDKEVLEPLRVAQAEKAREDAEKERIAAEKAAEAARIAEEARKAKKARIAAEEAQKASERATQQSTTLGGAWAALRQCESGGSYEKNTGNGYYGAYQFDIGTWANYGGYRIPSDAPPAVQDAKAMDTQARRGWSPWPACSKKLGLSSGGS